MDKVKIPKGISKIEGESNDEEINVDGNVASSDDDDVNGITRTPQGESNNSQGGRGTPTGANEDADSNNHMKKWVAVGATKVRLLNIDSNRNKYKLMITPDKAAPKGYILVMMSGEQSTISAKILSAYLDCKDVIKLKCSDGKIFLNSFREKEKISVIFQLDYEDSCSMEVELYGYSL